MFTTRFAMLLTNIFADCLCWRFNSVSCVAGFAGQAPLHTVS